MQSNVAPEISGPLPQIRLPRTATRRGAATYCQIVRRVTKDPIWGGWRFDGPLLRPGAILPAKRLPLGTILLECADVLPGGWGHNRAPCLYILWKLEPDYWRELARVATENRDWTLDLGPIAKAELHPPAPVMVDPAAAAGRVMAALVFELAPLRREAQVAVVRECARQLAGRMVG